MLRREQGARARLLTVSAHRHKQDRGQENRSSFVFERSHHFSAGLSTLREGTRENAICRNGPPEKKEPPRKERLFFFTLGQFSCRSGLPRCHSQVHLLHERGPAWCSTDPSPSL